MEKILDPSDFNDVMAIMREHAAALPHAQDALTALLGTLIENALAELAGEKFDMPRRCGDLDDADGINHLLNDYPPEVPPGKFFREAFLTTNEEAAARYLLKLYLARDFLAMGFGIAPDTLREIEETGRALLDWRLYGPAMKHDKEKRAEKRGASKGGATKAEREAKKLADRDKRIKNRAGQLVGLYNKTEALDILEREFSKRFVIGRPRIAQIVSSIFPTKRPRAKSSE